MSTPKIVAIAIFVISGGVSSVLFFINLARHNRNPQQPWKPWLWLGMLVFDGLLFLLLWFGFTFGEAPPAFMKALKADDTEAAYLLLNDDLQREFGGERGFAEWSAGLQPRRWFFNSMCSGGGLARADGTGRFESGDRFSVSFYLIREEGEWRIMGITFWHLEPYYDVGRFNGMDCSD
jgi:hypothetical protein